MKKEELFGDLPTLETKRLLLRKVKSEDAEDMYQYASDKEVTKYVTWDAHPSLSSTKKFIQFILDQYENKRVAPWGIQLKENGRFIGTIDYVQWQPEHRNAELGYAISREYWGHGLTTEAAKEIIKLGFGPMELERIQAKCFVNNIGSQRVMEKAGMTLEGIIRKGMYIKGRHQDLKLYSILREEY